MKKTRTPRFLGLTTLLILLLLSAGRVSAQAPTWQWATSPGTTDDTGDGATRAAVDAAGNVYVAGNFHNTATFGTTTLTSAGQDDVFVAKLSRNGVYQWALRAGGTNNDNLKGIAVDSTGNVYVSGEYTSAQAVFGATTLTNATGSGDRDGFVAGLSAAGAWQWAVGAGGSGADYCSALAADNRGSVYVTGEFRSTMALFGPFTLTNANTNGTPDAFVARLSAGGAWQWAVRAGGLSPDFGNAITVDGTGDVYLTGSFTDSASFGPTAPLRSRGGWDVFVAKLSPAGSWQWSVRAGSTSSDTGTQLATDRANNVYVTGNLWASGADFGPTTLGGSGGTELFVTKLTSRGGWQWAVRAGGTDLDYGWALAADPGGNVYVTGEFSSATFPIGTTTLTNPTGVSALFVAKLTTNGAWEWVTRAAGPGLQYSRGVAVDGTGRVYVAGLCFGDITFGATTLPSTGRFSGNIFLARLSPPPTGLPAETAAPAFTLAPNPAHHTATLTGLAPGAAVTLLDGVGRTVRQEQADAAGTTTLDVRGLPTGLYLVRAGGATQRLVVE